MKTRLRTMEDGGYHSAASPEMPPSRKLLSHLSAVFLLGVLFGVIFAPETARAHWCDCLWESRYNIVVRPAVDSVEVPSSGQVTFTVWLQNNMGYPLYDYRIQAYASSYNISVSIDSDTRPYPDFVMPGERLRHDLFVSRSGGGTLSIDDIGFYVGFGHDNIQPRLYGSSPNTVPSADAIVKHQSDGSLYPSSPSISGGSQARHMISSARADFSASERATGITDLLNEYCAGRHSWSSGDPASPDTSYCPTPDGSGDTTCPGQLRSTSTTKYQWQHLWAAGELAYRKNALSSNQLQAFRDRLKCGQDENVFAFKAYALFALGYLGEGSFSSDVGGGTVASFLGGIANTSSAEGCAANAALLMAGGSNTSSVTTCLGTSNEFAQILAGAALNVSGNDPNDTHIKTEVLNRVDWTNEPEATGGLDLFAAHVANIVAWHHRGWAALGNDSGTVSFYNEEDVPPRAPNISCAVTSTDPPVFAVSWPAVTQGTNNQAEQYSVGYRIYWGTASGSYVHVAYTPGTSFSPPDVTVNTNYYVTVVTVDDSMNVSADSAEITCNVPVNANPPVASLNCNTTSGVCTSPTAGSLNCGTAPVTVECSCDCAGISWGCDPSSDPNSNINHCWITLDNGSREDILGSSATYTFSAGGSHNVSLEVTDGTGLSDTDSLSIAVDDPNNQAPTAVATAAPNLGGAPLEVAFNAASSTDPDGSITGWEWDFHDGSTSMEENPTHTFDSSGEYDVRLTVTDDGDPALTGTDVVRITVSDQAINRPPPTDCGVVTPTSGRAPLTISLDASSCVDPDGDIITFNWSVGSWQVAPVDYTGPMAEHTLSERGEYSVSLAMVDDGSPPRQVSQNFDVTVLRNDGLEGDLPPLIAGCSCDSSPSSASALLIVAGAGLLLVRRRCRR